MAQNPRGTSTSGRTPLWSSERGTLSTAQSVFEMGSHVARLASLTSYYVVRGALGLLTLLPPPLQCWKERHASPCLVCAVLQIKTRGSCMPGKHRASMLPAELRSQPPQLLWRQSVHRTAAKRTKETFERAFGSPCSPSYPEACPLGQEFKEEPPPSSCATYALIRLGI